MVPEAAAPTARTGPVLLAMSGIAKGYPGVVALEAVAFDVRAGEVHALMGQNGAGKSTLIKILTGAVPADGGRMVLSGREVRPRTPAHAQRLGISAVYQEVNLIPTLSVAENLFLGRQPSRWWGVDWGGMRRHAVRLMAELGIDIDVDRPVGTLPLATQQMIAIARAVDLKACILVLDEPTSSLDRRECEQLFAIMSRLRERGLGLVFITHFLEQVYRISDRITVLRGGRVVGTFAASDLSRVQLVGAMLGRAAEEVAPDVGACVQGEASTQKPALRVRGLARRGVMEPIDLEIRSGEVVGLAGLLGSGRTETAGLIFGAIRPDQGSVECRERRVRAGSPRDAISAGLGLSPEDRKSEGLFLSMSIRDNISIVAQRRLGTFARWGMVSRRDHERMASGFIRSMGISAADSRRPARTLSGGNQQKVLLARWLANQPAVLILDEPTRGVDIAGKAQIEMLVRDLSSSGGMAIIFISAELDEVVRRCGRVLVLKDREVIGELRGSQVSEGVIMRMVAG